MPVKATRERGKRAAAGKEGDPGGNGGGWRLRAGETGPGGWRRRWPAPSAPGKASPPAAAGCPSLAPRRSPLAAVRPLPPRLCRRRSRLPVLRRLPPLFPACLCPASCALQRACSGARPFRRARLRVVRRLIFVLSRPPGRCERLRRGAEGERAAKELPTALAVRQPPCSMIGGKTRRVKDLRPSATAAAEWSEYWPPSLTRYLRPRFCGRRLANRC